MLGAARARATARWCNVGGMYGIEPSRLQQWDAARARIWRSMSLSSCMRRGSLTMLASSCSGASCCRTSVADWRNGMASCGSVTASHTFLDRPDCPVQDSSLRAQNPSQLLVSDLGRSSERRSRTTAPASAAGLAHPLSLVYFCCQESTKINDNLQYLTEHAAVWYNISEQLARVHTSYDRERYKRRG